MDAPSSSSATTAITVSVAIVAAAVLNWLLKLADLFLKKYTQGLALCWWPGGRQKTDIFGGGSARPAKKICFILFFDLRVKIRFNAW